MAACKQEKCALYNLQWFQDISSSDGFYVKKNCPRFFDYQFAILSVFVSHFFRLCIVSFIKKNNGKPNELSRDQPS